MEDNSLNTAAMALAAHFSSSHPVCGQSSEIICFEEHLAVYDKGAFGAIVYTKMHVRTVFILLSRFVEKIIYSLWVPQILACKSKPPALAIIPLHQCNCIYVS